jgi:hypothetical protein
MENPLEVAKRLVSAAVERTRRTQEELQRLRGLRDALRAEVAKAQALRSTVNSRNRHQSS